MSNLKFEVSIDTSDLKEVKAALAFFQVLAEEEMCRKPYEHPDKFEERKELAKKPGVKKVEDKCIHDTTEIHDKDKVSEKVFTLEDVRKLVSEKAKAYKTEIKAKLQELEAQNVAKLDAAKFPEFITFLQGLK